MKYFVSWIMRCFTFKIVSNCTKDYYLKNQIKRLIVILKNLIINMDGSTLSTSLLQESKSELSLL